MSTPSFSASSSASRPASWKPGTRPGGGGGPPPCDVGELCACGCVTFVWTGSSYTMTDNYCTGACSPPAPPGSYWGDTIFRCCE